MTSSISQYNGPNAFDGNDTKVTERLRTYIGQLSVLQSEVTFIKNNGLETLNRLEELAKNFFEDSNLFKASMVATKPDLGLHPSLVSLRAQVKEKIYEVRQTLAHKYEETYGTLNTFQKMIAEVQRLTGNSMREELFKEGLDEGFEMIDPSEVNKT
jgi:ABC-type thiamine transport system ATPase subunit